MIIVITETPEPWFQYIWDQFARINSLDTEHLITTYDRRMGKPGSGKHVFLEYGDRQRIADSLFIPARKEFRTDDYVWFRDDLPVYRATIEDNSSQAYDIFYNAFVHLSRLEEWESEKNGRLINSYSLRHPRKEKKIWTIPVVNHLFNELEDKIRKKFPEVSFGGKAKPLIEFSHDVDYLYKTPQLRIKQSLFHFFNSFRYLLKLEPGKSLSKLKHGIEFAVKSSEYWHFDMWTELEKELNIKSVYYIFAMAEKRGTYNLKRWLIDPSYDIAGNEKLKEKCRELVSNGNSIGIHGSYLSAEDEDLFIREKEILQDSISHKITRSRQHWLNYYELRTPYILEHAGIEQDSTIGFNDVAGFRMGVASAYNPYDHKNKRPFSFLETPLVVMDSHLYDYSDRPDDLEWLSESVKAVKNFTVSVDWHQRVISQDYGWDEGYRRLASMIMNNDE